MQATEYHNTAMPYSFQKDDPIWYEDFSMTGKKLKLTPKCTGPAKIQEINETNACIILPSGKSKVINLMGLKKFFAPKMTPMKI